MAKLALVEKEVGGACAEEETTLFAEVRNEASVPLNRLLLLDSLEESARLAPGAKLGAKKAKAVAQEPESSDYGDFGDVEDFMEVKGPKKGVRGSREAFERLN